MIKYAPGIFGSGLGVCRLGPGLGESKTAVQVHQTHVVRF